MFRMQHGGTQEGEARGCMRGCVWRWGSTGVEERVINQVWVTHNEI